MALSVAALTAGCTSDDEERAAAPPAATSTQAGDRRGSEGQSAARREVRLLRLGSFSEPTYLTAPRGDRRRFVVERSGRILIVKGGRVLDEPFLDMSGEVSTGGESGLLSMAFAPDYAQSRRFYVYYTDQQGYINIAQYRGEAGNPDRADAGSRRTVIRVPHRRSNHKGGQIQFGPDGRLYAGFGDGGGGGDPDENAQNLSRMLGKLIRIEPKAAVGTRSRGATRSAIARALARKCSRTGCATPTGSHSTVAAARSPSAMSARMRWRRSTTHRGAAARARRVRARTSAGTCGRAVAATRAARRAATCLLRSPTPRTAVTARSSAAT